MASSPLGQSIAIPHPDRAGKFFNGYLVKPVQAPAPAVLLLHEAFGLNSNMRELAQRFANAGYVALAVDLYSDGNKMICMARAFYGMLFSPMENSTAKNVRASFKFLQAVDGVVSGRVGAIGFCMGGNYALQLTCSDTSVRAISVVSGLNPKPLAALQRACPIVGSYAERDFASGDGKKLDVVLDEYRIPHEIKIYPNGIHSIFRDTAKGYDADIAQDAWNRTLAFFEQHFQG